MTRSQLTFSLIFLAMAAGLFVFFQSKVSPNTVARIGAGKEVVLQRDLSGHYRVEAMINGVKVDVLVDTGATDVSISAALADRLGVSSQHAIRTHTANGDAVAYMTRLDSIRLGGIDADDVAAIIVPGMDGEALLGMSFLGRMDVRLFRGQMTIRTAQD